VIDGSATGWDEIQARELDGKVGQELLLFADDFQVLATGVEPIPAIPAAGLMVLGAGLAAAARRPRGSSRLPRPRASARTRRSESR